MAENQASEEKKSEWAIKPEYLLVAVLLVIGMVSLPAVKDVYLVKSLILSVCTGLGFQ
tara:strand:+ start:669 stop:842 length:174 start_codon:yes stop_codon:yes gene_type:complete